MSNFKSLVLNFQTNFIINIGSTKVIMINVPTLILFPIYT